VIERHEVFNLVADTIVPLFEWNARAGLIVAELHELDQLLLLKNTLRPTAQEAAAPQAVAALDAGTWPVFPSVLTVHALARFALDPVPFAVRSDEIAVRFVPVDQKPLRYFSSQSNCFDSRSFSSNDRS
jgi:hypothetical protein